MTQRMHLFPGVKAVAILGKKDERKEVLIWSRPFPTDTTHGATIKVLVSGEEEPRIIALERIVEVTHTPPLII
jgi:hypothetical protein